MELYLTLRGSFHRTKGMDDTGYQSGASSSSLDSANINAILRKWSKAIEDNDNVFRLTGATEKRKRLEKFRESTLRSNAGDKVEQRLVRPWNYSDFLERLSSFTSMSWFAKPSLISALECARCGWVNDGQDKLTCTFCKVQLWHYYDDYNGSRLSALLTTSHDASCGWSGNFSPMNFKQYPITSEEQLRDEYCVRFQSNIINSYLNGLELDLSSSELSKALAGNHGGKAVDAIIREVVCIFYILRICLICSASFEYLLLIFISQYYC